MPKNDLKIRNFTFLFLFMSILCALPAGAGEHRFGLGAHFFKTVDDIADDGFSDIEDDGYAFVVSYRYEPGGFIFFQLEADYYKDGYGGATESALAPAVFVGVGRDIYVAIGLAATYSDDFDGSFSDPYYIGRIGYDLDLLPGISLDINVNYQAGSFSEIEDFDLDTDTLTLGASIRFTL